MKIELMVRVEGEYWHGFAATTVPELVCRFFDPMQVSDDPVFGLMGDKLAGSREEKIVIKAREDAAKILSEQLTEMIVAAMAKNDTLNGYAK